MSRIATARATDPTAAISSASAFESVLRKAAHVPVDPLYPPLPRPGQLIADKYRIEARLGCGGMGAVFRATHVVSEKVVAIKWMLRSTADEQARRRFLREALAAGRIDHPNVVDVYDVGQAGECAYLVMELLHGESLRARLDRSACRISIAQTVRWLLPALRGVCAAHQAGVIHRDLKPDNIYLCEAPDGSPREAKVLDFGVSAVVEYNTSDATITHDGTVLGTPAYMAPEQCQSARDADARSDVYAIGVILYEALTGQLPFQASSYPGLVLAIMHRSPRPPSEWRPDLPHGLEQLVLRALAKRPEDRYPSVESLIEALNPFASEPEVGGPKRPRRRSIAIGVGLVVGLLCALQGAMWSADEANRDPKAKLTQPVLPIAQAPVMLDVSTVWATAPEGPSAESSVQPHDTLAKAPPERIVAGTVGIDRGTPSTYQRSRRLRGASATQVSVPRAGAELVRSARSGTITVDEL